MSPVASLTTTTYPTRSASGSPTRSASATGSPTRSASATGFSSRSPSPSASASASASPSTPLSLSTVQQTPTVSQDTLKIIIPVSICTAIALVGLIRLCRVYRKNVYHCWATITCQPLPIEETIEYRKPTLVIRRVNPAFRNGSDV
jgi:hypothetical protein